MFNKERDIPDIKCFRTTLERLDCGCDVLRTPDFECDDLKAEHVGRCLGLAHLRRGVGIPDIGHDSQPAQTGDNLAQEFDSLASNIGLLEATARWHWRPVRARLATRPLPTGSVDTANTIGMIHVACFAAGTPDAVVTMTSTLSRTNSAANSA